jgi:hypothetical protein
MFTAPEAGLVFFSTEKSGTIIFSVIVPLFLCRRIFKSVQTAAPSFPSPSVLLFIIKKR